MSLSRLHRRGFFRWFTLLYPIAILLTLLWGESGSYLWSRLRWHVPHPASATTNSLGILIVADPQLVGFKNENHMAGPLTRWDSDRFLSKGFSQALLATNPDLVVFLGDLFDEGLEANDAELEWTLSRFNGIFESNIPKIFISGDNDVGGEVEPVKSLLTTRFSQLFSNSFPSSNTIFDFLSFTEVNLMNGEVTPIRESSGWPELRVILSHVPFAIPSYHDAGKFIATLAPDLILSAHDHKASIYHLSRGGGSVNYTDLTAANGIRKETVGGDWPILEMQTPTCSYRMGTFDVGYGFVRINRLGDSDRFQVAFSILWLTSRFYALMLYAAMLAMGLLVLFVELGFLLFSRRIKYRLLMR